MFAVYLFWKGALSMDKILLKKVSKGLGLLAILIALINAYLGWFEDRGSGLLVMMVLLLIFISAIIRYAFRL